MGFFDTNEIIDKSPAGCSTCGRYRLCKYPRMSEPVGEGRKGILILHGQPTEEEDSKGSSFSGGYLAVLRQKLSGLGISIDRDCKQLYTVACYGKNPIERDIKAHYPTVISAIREIGPKLVILLGDIPLRSILGPVWGSDLYGLERWRGLTFPLLDLNCWGVATFDPQYIENQWDKDLFDALWTSDLKAGLSKLDNELPESDLERYVEVIHSKDRAIEVLDKLLKRGGSVAFDYETSSTKPEAPGHWIECASFSPWPGDRAFCFHIGKGNENSEVAEKWKEVLRSRNISKVAHNAAFEDRWSRTILKQTVSNWNADTMQLAHIEDNRRNFTGLKFQSFLKFGITGYEDEMKRYLIAPSSNEFNTVDKAPRQKLMLYCGLDSLLTMRLFVEYSRRRMI